MNKVIFVHTEWIRPKTDLKSDFGWTLSADKKESIQFTCQNGWAGYRYSI